MSSTGDEKRTMTFERIAAEQGEEAAIRAGIDADPDTMELDEEWFAKARPVSEAHPQVVEAFRRRRGKTEGTDQRAAHHSARRRSGSPFPRHRQGLADSNQQTTSRIRFRLIVTTTLLLHRQLFPIIGSSELQ